MFIATEAKTDYLQLFIPPDVEFIILTSQENELCYLSVMRRQIRSRLDTKGHFLLLLKFIRGWECHTSRLTLLLVH